jgi:hypothetical protein
MRYRLMATYLGVPYHAGLGPDGTEVTLFSPGPPPEELGFTGAAGHWRKQVGVADLQALWQSRLVGEYRGEPCLVLDDLGERLHIVYLGRDAVRARQLGYWEIDREVFEVVVARGDVDGLTEERVEFPLSAATFPSSSPAPRSGADPLSVVLPSASVFRPAGAEPEPDTLIHGRLGPQGRVEPRAHTEPTGPRTRMEPIRAQPPAQPPRAQPPAQPPRGQPPAQPARAQPSAQPPRGQPLAEGAGYADSDRGPRTPDRMAAWHGSPSPEPWSEPWPGREPQPEPWPEPWTDSESRASSEHLIGSETRAEAQAASPPGRRTARRDRVSPQSVFAELLNLADIPHVAYAVDEEVPGAMCVVKADGGFEVFSCTEDARLEVHFFEDEEAAYFYLFGVLAAEAVRSGRLGSTRPNGYVNGCSGPASATASTASRENVSKYLRSRKLPRYSSHPAIVN